jgi:hypothetical protein
MARTLLRFLAGAAVGAVVWWYLTPGYNEVVARPCVRVLRFDHRLPDIKSAPEQRWLQLRSESGRFPPVKIPADQLTYNLILYAGLIATERRMFRDRQVLMTIVGIMVLFVAHIAAFAAVSESSYATVLGEWSEAHYGELEANIWVALQMFYRLVAMFAIPFALWWWRLRIP